MDDLVWAVIDIVIDIVEMAFDSGIPNIFRSSEVTCANCGRAYNRERKRCAYCGRVREGSLGR